jgi:integral membrane sensor domain MASE1
VVAPVILTWATLRLRGIGRRELVEGGVALVLLVALAEIPPQRDVPYMVFPVLLWSALRFGPRGASAAIFVVCSITVWNTAQDDGPFVRESITDSTTQGALSLGKRRRPSWPALVSWHAATLPL